MVSVLVQIVRGGRNENALNFLAEVPPEVPNVARDEVSRPRLHSSKENGDILFGQRKPGRKFSERGIKKTNTMC